MQPPKTSEATSSRRARWAVVLAGAGGLIVALDVFIVATALPSIHASLGGDFATLQWIVSAYLLTYGAGIIPASALGDRLGRRAVFASGLAIFSLSSALCALSPSLYLLIVARGLQGLGAAFVTPLGLTILTSAFPPNLRGRMIGIWAGVSGVGVAAGPVLGGVLIQGIDWHWIFWVNVPIGLLAAALSLVKLEETPRLNRRLDVLGVGLVTSASLGLMWSLVTGPTAGWASPEVVGTAGLGALLLALFVLWERRAESPMIPPRLFTSRTFSAGNGVAFLALPSLWSALLLIEEYFQTVLGYSPLVTGLGLLPWTLAPLIVSPTAGKLADKVGARPLLVGGMLLQVVGFSWLVLVANPTSSYLSVILPLVVAGAGISMVLPTAPMAVLGAVRPEDLGKASGTMNSIMRFGGAAIVALGSSIFTAEDATGSAAGFMAGFRAAMWVSIGLSLLAATFALGVAPKGRPRPRSKIVPIFRSRRIASPPATVRAGKAA